MVITSLYLVFLPSRRVLSLSLTGAVLAGISTGAGGVAVTGDASQANMFNSVVGATGASRGFSGVQ
jgi:hypothetical protein